MQKISEYVYGELEVEAVMYYGASKPILLWKSDGIDSKLEFNTIVMVNSRN